MPGYQTFWFVSVAQAGLALGVEMSIEKGWSCSTLMAGMKAISGQSSFLKGASDAELMAELADTSLGLARLLFWSRSLVNCLEFLYIYIYVYIY